MAVHSPPRVSMALVPDLTELTGAGSGPPISISLISEVEFHFCFRVSALFSASQALRRHLLTAQVETANLRTRRSRRGLRPSCSDPCMRVTLHVTATKYKPKPKEVSSPVLS